MAITRVYQTGFELGTIIGTEINTYLSDHASGSTLTIETSGKKTGTYCLKNTNGGSDGYAEYLSVWSFAATAQLRIGMHVYFSAGPAYAYKPNASIYLVDGSSNILIWIGLRDDNQTLYLYVNGVNRDTYTPVTKEKYYHLGIDVKKHGSTGWVYVYLDGVEIMSYSGNTVATTIAALWVGHSYRLGGTVQVQYVGSLYIDDLTIDNTTGEAAAARVPDVRYLWSPSNADGSYTEWDVSTLLSDHHSMVDDLPHDSDTTYIYTNVTGEKDSFGLVDFTTPTNAAIVAFIPTFVGKKNGSEEIQTALGIITGVDELSGTLQNMPTTYGLYQWERYTTQGDGASAWDDTAVDGVKVLIEAGGSFT